MNSIKINEEGELITIKNDEKLIWCKEIYSADEYLIYKGEKWFLKKDDDLEDFDIED